MSGKNHSIAVIASILGIVAVLVPTIFWFFKLRTDLDQLQEQFKNVSNVDTSYVSELENKVNQEILELKKKNEHLIQENEQLKIEFENLSEQIKKAETVGELLDLQGKEALANQLTKRIASLKNSETEVKKVLMALKSVDSFSLVSLEKRMKNLEQAEQSVAAALREIDKLEEKWKKLQEINERKQFLKDEVEKEIVFEDMVQTINSLQITLINMEKENNGVRLYYVLKNVYSDNYWFNKLKLYDQEKTCKINKKNYDKVKYLSAKTIMPDSEYELPQKGIVKASILFENVVFEDISSISLGFYFEKSGRYFPSFTFDKIKREE